MPDLLRLPLRAAGLATAPARFALRTAWNLLRSDDDGERPGQPTRADTAQRPTPVVEEPAEKPPPRPKGRATQPKAKATRARAGTTAAKRRTPSPKQSRRAARNEPTKGEAAAMRQQQRMEEQNAGGPGPGPTIDVAPPWEGYDRMTEEQILERLTGADSATRGAVRLYEGLNQNRQQVIFATDAPVADNAGQP